MGLPLHTCVLRVLTGRATSVDSAWACDVPDAGIRRPPGTVRILFYADPSRAPQTRAEEPHRFEPSGAAKADRETGLVVPRRES